MPKTVKNKTISGKSLPLLYINTLCGQNVEFVKLQLVVHIVTIRL